MQEAAVKTGRITHASHNAAAPRDSITYSAVSNDGQWSVFDIKPLTRMLGEGIAQPLIVPAPVGSECLMGKFLGVTQIILVCGEKFNAEACQP